MRHSTPVLNRRMLGVAAACVLAVGSSLTPAFAATPKDTLVITWAMDDIITMDPGEAFEISAGEIMGNAYDRLIRYDVNDPSKLCLLYTSPSPRDRTRSRMPSSA